MLEGWDRVSGVPPAVDTGEGALSLRGLGKLPQELWYWIIPQIPGADVRPQGWRAAAHAPHLGGEGLKAGDKNGRVFAREAPSSGKPGCRQDQELMGGSQDLGLLSSTPLPHPWE